MRTRGTLTEVLQTVAESGTGLPVRSALENAFAPIGMALVDLPATGLVEGERLLATAQQYDLSGTCDGQAVRIRGIGSAQSFRITAAAYVIVSVAGRVCTLEELRRPGRVRRAGRRPAGADVF